MTYCRRLSQTLLAEHLNSSINSIIRVLFIIKLFVQKYFVFKLSRNVSITECEHHNITFYCSNMYCNGYCRHIRILES
jgi:hypothetical protein